MIYTTWKVDGATPIGVFIMATARRHWEFRSFTTGTFEMARWDTKHHKDNHRLRPQWEFMNPPAKVLISA